MSINLEPVPFGNTFSMKNIPVPGRKEHKTKTIKQTGKLIKNVRWAGLFAKHGTQLDSLDHPDSKLCNQVRSLSLFRWRTLTLLNI